MTSPSGMSCETCRDLLIELVCDELTAETAAAVRAHALKCERCGPELEKLSGTLQASSALELLSPSPEVERRIMQAAREAIAGRARGPAREAAQGVSYGITAWFARLGSFAMSPQVAMASVLLLVVGIGLYALPFGRDAEPSALRATEDESEEARPGAPSPAASATATPMGQPEQAERDERKERERESLNQGLGGVAGPTRKAPPVGELSRKSASRGAPQDPLVGGDGAGRSSAAERGPRAQAFPGAKSESTKLAKPKAGAPGNALSDDFADREGASAKANAAPRAKELAEAESAPAGEKRYAAPPPPAAPLAEAPAAATTTPSKSADKGSQGVAAAALEQGIAAVKRGDHSLGASLLKPLATSGAGSERTTAMLWLARSLRERGDCAGALAYYRVLTQPVTAPRAVLEEAADCQARTGNAEAARKLLDRATPTGAKQAPASKP